jgi:hypothetical protein
VEADKEREKYAERIGIIESRIEMRIEALGGHLTTERKSCLKEMTLCELQELASHLEGARTSQDAISMTVRAISASEQARRAAEDAKYEELGGPARMDMDC